MSTTRQHLTAQRLAAMFGKQFQREDGDMISVFTLTEILHNPNMAPAWSAWLRQDFTYMRHSPETRHPGIGGVHVSASTPAALRRRLSKMQRKND